jgi:hypothetical protein
MSEAASEQVEIQPLESWDGDVAPVESAPQEVEAPVAEEVVVEEAPAEEPKVEAETAQEEVPVDLFRVKVNGKEEEVSIEDLKSNYSGKVAYDKKFTELDKERKQFLSEKQQIDNYISEFRGVAQSKNMLEATKLLGKLSGKAPHDIVNELITALQPEIERREFMTDEELSFENKQVQQKYQQEKLESDRKTFEQEQAQNALNAKVSEVMTNHNISSEEWASAVNELDARLPQDQALTPELVGEFVSYNKASSRAASALENFEGGKFVSDSQISEGLRDIILENSDFSDDDIQDILKQSLTEPQKEVEEKLQEKAASRTTNQNESQSQFEEIASWDDVL